jgi:hypothetical protein
MERTASSQTALVCCQLNPADPGSAARTFDLDPAQRHPAEVVIGALVRGRAIRLDDGQCYRLDESLSLCRGADGAETLADREVAVGDFLRLCAQLSLTETCDIAHGKSCAPPAPRVRSYGRARDVNVADAGSAVRMFALHPTRKHPAEVVVGALLRARAVDLGDGRCYRLGEDLSIGHVGIGPGDGTGFVVIHELPVSAFLRLCAQLSFNEMCDIARGKTCAVEARRALARLSRAGAH